MCTEQICVISGSCIKNEDEVSYEKKIFCKPSVFFFSFCLSNVCFLLQLCFNVRLFFHTLSTGVAYLCVIAVKQFLNDPQSEINTTYLPVPVPFTTAVCGVIHTLSTGVAYLCVIAVKQFLNDPQSEINTTYLPVPVPFTTAVCGVIIL